MNRLILGKPLRSAPLVGRFHPQHDKHLQFCQKPFQSNLLGLRGNECNSSPLDEDRTVQAGVTCSSHNSRAFAQAVLISAQGRSTTGRKIWRKEKPMWPKKLLIEHNARAPLTHPCSGLPNIVHGENNR